MSYSGLVRAKTGCHFGGFYHGPGRVFEVQDIDLWSDSPFEPVILSHVAEEPTAGPPPSTRLVSHYARVHVKVRPASERS